MNLNWKKIKVSALSLSLGLFLFGAAAPVHAASYQATDDDTFWKLSVRYNIPLRELMQANPQVDPYNIYKGLTLNIPGRNIPAGRQNPQGATAKLSNARTIYVTATAYSASPEENGPWGAVDYFGNPLKLGTIAVDPSVIPLGSKVYITGYDHDILPSGGMVAYAKDAGSAIKGNRIDIFIPGQTNARGFGIQNLTLTILK
ncbi:3D domain-containing protein [Ferviditalea candida]|uniref:3D domain-containing protein n=1 Tax=Ferviditalea candida TaxID=3108399 RepID=A0ABU5ZG59_9BACL|nr:3D domain-containing protein [Paenibacillaceae bacterium T2]